MTNFDEDFFAREELARLKMGNHDDEQSKMKIFLKLTKTISLEINCSDTIGMIKNKVFMAEGISENRQELVFDGNHLVDAKTLADYNVTTNSTINLYIGNGMRLFVKMPSSGKTIMLQVKRSDTTHSLKAKIQEMEGIALRQQTLIYLGRILADNEMLISNEIRDNSMLNLVLRPLDDLRISISLASGETFVLEARSWYTIWDVKTVTESLKGLPAHQQKLVYAERELENNLTLHDYKITDGSTLQLSLCMQIFVKTSNNTLTMMVEKNDTIAIIMDKIEKKLGLQLKHQFLSYAGRVLQNEKSLAYYQIQDESTIHLRVHMCN